MVFIFPLGCSSPRRIHKKCLRSLLFRTKSHHLLTFNSNTSASLYTSLLKLGNTTLCTSLSCANSPKVTNAPVLSLAVLLSAWPFDFNTELVTFYQVREQFQDTVAIWCSVNRENHLLISCHQTAKFAACSVSPIIRLPACSTPPTTHTDMFTPFCMVGGHPPQEVFH